MIFRRKGADGLQLLAHGDVQFAAGSIVGRDDESVLGRLDIAPGDGADALFFIGNFLYAALLSGARRARRRFGPWPAIRRRI